MAYISFKQAIKNKIPDGDETYQKNSIIVNEWYKTQVDALIKKSSQAAIDFVNTSAKKFSAGEKPNSTGSADVNVYRDNDFLITYNFDFNNATFYFLNVPEEVSIAYNKCILLAPSDATGDVFGQFTYTIYENDELLINIGIGSIYVNNSYPISGVDSFIGAETEF